MIVILDLPDELDPDAVLLDLAARTDGERTLCRGLAPTVGAAARLLLEQCGLAELRQLTFALGAIKRKAAGVPTADPPGPAGSNAVEKV